MGGANDFQVLHLLYLVFIKSHDTSLSGGKLLGLRQFEVLRCKIKFCEVFPERGKKISRFADGVFCQGNFWRVRDGRERPLNGIVESGNWPGT